MLETWLPRPAVTAAPAPVPVRSARWRAAQLALGVALAAGAGLLVRNQLAGAVRVVSTSMLPTVLPGDYLMVRRANLVANPPRRGDVVVFAASGNLEGPPELIKRVIGLPGDEITMDGGRPVINGTPVPACDAGAFVYFSRTSSPAAGWWSRRWTGSATWRSTSSPLPASCATRSRPGEVFVLGDNRGLSNDSRSWNDQRGRGVPLAAIEGRAGRVLIGRHRDGRSDFGRLLKPLGTQVHLPEVDVAGLQAGIDRCLAAPAARLLGPDQHVVHQHPERWGWRNDLAATRRTVMDLAAGRRRRLTGHGPPDVERHLGGQRRGGGADQVADAAGGAPEPDVHPAPPQRDPIRTARPRPAPGPRIWYSAIARASRHCHDPPSVPPIASAPMALVTAMAPELARP